MREGGNSLMSVTNVSRGGLTRRGILAGVGVGAAAAAGGLADRSAASTGPTARTAARTTAGRIDVHHHAVPDAMRRWAVEQGLLPEDGGPTWAQWTLEGTLRTMRDNGIAAGIASAPV